MTKNECCNIVGNQWRGGCENANGGQVMAKEYLRDDNRGVSQVMIKGGD